METKARDIAERLFRAGAKDCVMVGGYVRDRLMGISSKDVDLEVYGLGYDEIVAALREYYHVDLVGKSFGVVKVDNQVDVGIPRRENKRGLGHKGFSVKADPDMSYREAALRRDFTVNSISLGFDGRIIDPFNGQVDLKQGILRATSPAFKEDPLRVLRGMQFAARFGFTMEARTIEMCKEVGDEFQDLSKERIMEEWLKWSKGNYPSHGLKILQETGWLAHFPALAPLPETPQASEYHPEGDVFVHTYHVCDAAVEIMARRKISGQERAIIMFAALLHDVGKAETTSLNEKGRWISPGHAGAGVPIAKAFLKSMKAPGWLVEKVPPLVAEHMIHVSHPKDKDPSPRLIRRLASRLSPANIRLWATLCEADHSGRPPLPKHNPVVNWEAVAQALAVTDAKPKVILMGRHLLEQNYTPGPKLGNILKAAYEAQLDGQFETLEGALGWLASYEQNNMKAPGK